MALTAQDVLAKPQLANIPDKLKEYDHWLLWKTVSSKKDPQKMDKRPVSISGNPFNGWNEISNLYSFEEVSSAFETGKFDGIGFSPKDTPFVCIDLDNDRSIDDIPDELMEIMNEGYAEISPSKRGIHVWMQAEVPEGTGKKRRTKSGDDIELFTNSGWLTMTGDTSNPMNIEPKQFVVDGIISRYGFNPKPATPAPQLKTYTTPTDLNESEIIDKMLTSKSGGIIERLLQGDISGHHNDHSTADMALCSYLAFWTNKDAGMMDSIFRSSGLYRDKWDRQTGNSTYGNITVQYAIDNTQEGYTGRIQQDDYSISYNDTSAPIVKQAIDIDKPLVSKVKDEIEAMDLSKMTLNDLTPAQISVIDDEQRKELYLRTNANNYVQQFMDGITASVDTPAIPTGFKDLDGILEGGLYEGLYFIGAISSLGKTTIVIQIADQIAQQGQDVLFFSLEMARSEIMAKSISRITLTETLENGLPEAHAKTIRGITAGKRYPEYSTAEKELISNSIKKYSTFADSLYIHEGIGTIGADEIRRTVERHKEYTGNTPVVVIDYLQILAPDDKKASDKQNTDSAVLKLKRLSRDFKTPIIGISSFNRENYKRPVSMASFKESGAIEYSSDVLIGLQFVKQREVDEKNKVKKSNDPLLIVDADEEKDGDPRKIELKILKNRNGATGGSVDFDYHPKYNHFVETGTANSKPNKPAYELKF